MDRKIRILFDANPLARQKTGVGYYTEGVVKALAEIPGLELVGFYFGQRRPVSGLPKADNLSYQTCPWLVGQATKALRKIGIRLPWELLARRKADILFFPDFTTWPSLFRTPKIVVIHDLTFIDLPQYVQTKNLRFLKKYVARDARHADLVLTVSNFSKQRIMDEFDLPAQKVLVESPPPPITSTPKKPVGLPPKYLLAISTIEPRKNFEGLAKAYELLPDEVRAEYSLVIAGSQGWNSDSTIAYIKGLQTKGENIVLCGYVSDPARAALYKNAELVVVPSFYEGFGMPITEAMSYGKAVAASNISVFRELAGDAVLYFDPMSPTSIKNTMEKLLNNAKLRNSQIKKADQLLGKLSWPAVAKDISLAIGELVPKK